MPAALRPKGVPGHHHGVHNGGPWHATHACQCPAYKRSTAAPQICALGRCQWGKNSCLLLPGKDQGDGCAHQSGRWEAGAILSILCGPFWGRHGLVESPGKVPALSSGSTPLTQCGISRRGQLGVFVELMNSSAVSCTPSHPSKPQPQCSSPLYRACLLPSGLLQPGRLPLAHLCMTVLYDFLSCSVQKPLRDLSQLLSLVCRLYQVNWMGNREIQPMGKGLLSGTHGPLLQGEKPEVCQHLASSQREVRFK